MWPLPSKNLIPYHILQYPNSYLAKLFIRLMKNGLNKIHFQLFKWRICDPCYLWTLAPCLAKILKYSLHGFPCFVHVRYTLQTNGIITVKDFTSLSYLEDHKLQKMLKTKTKQNKVNIKKHILYGGKIFHRYEKINIRLENTLPQLRLQTIRSSSQTKI